LHADDENPARHPGAAAGGHSDEPIFKLPSLPRYVRRRRCWRSAKSGEESKGNPVPLPRTASSALRAPARLGALDFHDRLKAHRALRFEGTTSSRPHTDEPGQARPAGQRRTSDALSIIVNKDKAYQRGPRYRGQAEEIVQRQQYEVAIQRRLVTVIAREDRARMRNGRHRDVSYGGDIAAKRQVLEKQKEARSAEAGGSGKSRTRSFWPSS